MAPGSRSGLAERLAPAIYNAVLHAAVPFASPFLLWRGLRQGKYLDLLPERLGWRAPDPAPPLAGVWIHAVSVGEVMAARTLALALGPALGAPVVLSSTTTAGLALARQAAASGAVAAAIASPLDFPGAVRRAFDRLRPRAVVLVEAELWPNWLAEARRRRVPVALVNARITARSLAGYRRAGWLFRPLFAGLAAVAARSEEDAERARALGSVAARVAVTGDLKFDAEPPARARAEERAALGLPAGSLVLAAGSVHAGEEEAVLGAFRRLRQTRPDAVLLLAPRKSFATPSAAAGLPLVRRSAGAPVPPGGVLLLDTIGELRDAYAAADIAFVGGSLVEAGGHNLIEPAAAGVPVLFGPSTASFAAVAGRLGESGGGFRVADGEALGREVLRLASDAGGRADAGARARQAVAAGGGACRRTVAWVSGALAGPAAGQLPPGDRAGGVAGGRGAGPDPP